MAFEENTVKLVKVADSSDLENKDEIVGKKKDKTVKTEEIEIFSEVIKKDDNDSSETESVKENSDSDKDCKDHKERELLDKTQKEDEVESDSKYLAKDESETSEEQVESKLKAEALSASLSSSRCLLKRNRDDLDTDSDKDSQDEEPDCKKSHKTITDKGDDAKEEETKVSEKELDCKEVDNKKASPIVVEKSKLSKEELIASMSSSKSVLKRGIDQVDDSDNDNVDNILPSDVKKSNIVIEREQADEEQTNKVEIEKNVVSKIKESINIPASSTPLTTSTRPSPLRPSLPSPPSLSPCPVLESTRLSPAKSPSSQPEKKDFSSLKSPQSPKEAVRIIAAKDLAEDRKLEKKRLNKLLAIFDDQKATS